MIFSYLKRTGPSCFFFVCKRALLAPAGTSISLILDLYLRFQHFALYLVLADVLFRYTLLGLSDFEIYVECSGGSGKDSRCFVCDVDVKKSIRAPRCARLRRDIAAGDLPSVVHAAAFDYQFLVKMGGFVDVILSKPLPGVQE